MAGASSARSWRRRSASSPATTTAGTTPGTRPPRRPRRRPILNLPAAIASAPVTAFCARRITTGRSSFLPARQPPGSKGRACLRKGRRRLQSMRRLVRSSDRNGGDPYEGTTLPGYFHRPDLRPEPRPIVIMHSGFDGSAEEMHVFGARAAVERGYNALVFDGPGQFGPVHREGLTFRPDWEKVVTPVFDFALTLPAVDPKRIALMGASLGGVLAPRAAAFEKRLAALIANDGLYDYGAAQLAGAPPEQRADALRLIKADHAPEMDAALEAIMKSRPTARWAFTHGMYVTGTASPRTYLAASLAFNVRDGIAEAIACPNSRLRRRGRPVLQGPAEGTLRPPDMPEDDDCLHRGGRRRRSLPGRREPPRFRSHLRLAGRNPGQMMRPQREGRRRSAMISTCRRGSAEANPICPCVTAPSACAQAASRSAASARTPPRAPNR